MERPRMKSLLKTATLATLPIAAGLACGNEKQIAPNNIPTNGSETETNAPYGSIQPAVEDIVDRFGGAVIFTAFGINNGERMIVYLTRVDLPEAQRKEFDNDYIVLTKNENSISALFPATSCDGEFELSVTMDEGKTYSVLPVPNINTRIPSETFTLLDDCTRPITFSLPPH
jgi:hypothetical protein